MALNVLQKDMLENPDLDPDELEENLNHKAELVEQLAQLDDGFSQIYDRVRADLTENRGAYSEDIAQMKRDITAIMDKSTAIQSQEKRNQVLMQQKFTSVKKQIKEVKKSRQAVNSYYRNMMKMGTPGSTFLDDKKQTGKIKKNFPFTIKYRDNRPIYITSKQDIVTQQIDLRSVRPIRYLQQQTSSRKEATLNSRRN